MNIRFARHVYRSPEGEEGGTGGAPPPPGNTPPPPPPAGAPTPPAPPPPSGTPPPPDDGKGKANWPENWRELASGGDEKTLKKLERYTDPGAVAKALRSVEVRISSGELRSQLPKDATPEQMTAWRTENGIPETPDKYDLTFTDGLVIGDNDKPLIDQYVKAMHGSNATPEQVKVGVKTYLQLQQQAAQRISEGDVDHKTALEDELRTEWGGDFRKNIGGVVSMLNQADKDVSAVIMNARGPDGRAIANDPKVMRWLAGHARQLGFVGGTVVPAGGDNAQGIDAEIKAIEATQYDDKGARNPAYWKEPKVQARYQELLSAKERLK